MILLGRMSFISWQMCVVFMITYNLHHSNSGRKEDFSRFPGNLQPFSLNPSQSPFIDLRPDEISTYNKPYVIPLLFLRRIKRYIPEFGYRPNDQKLNTSNIPSGDVSNKISDSKGREDNILTANLKSAIWEMKTNIETLYRKQDLIISYVKCSNQNNYRCRQIENQLLAVESLNWNHIIPSEFQKSDDFSSSDFFNNKNTNMNENDYIKTVLNSFKTAIQEQTVRQNLLYKYISCGPTVRNSCSAPVIPALKDAFQQTSTGNQNGFVDETTTVKSQNTFGNILSRIPLVNFPVSGNTWAEQFLRPFSQTQPPTNNQHNLFQGSNSETPSQVEQPIENTNFEANYQQPIQNTNFEGNYQQPIQNTNYQQPIKTGLNEDVLTKTEGKPVVTKKDKDDVSGLISEVWPESNQDQAKTSHIPLDETKKVSKQ